MARYPLGAPVRVSTTVRDTSGTLTTPTALTLAVRAPDGTTETYGSPSTTGTGLYYQDVPTADLPDAGRYAYAWTATGSGAGVVPGAFDVYDPMDLSVISLEDARQHLNFRSTDDDDELRYMVAATTRVVERLAGAVVPREVTEVVRQRGGQRSLMLATRPVLSVTSVTAINGGGTVDPGGLYVDSPLAGIVRRSDGGALAGGPWTVVYQAGRAEVPPHIGLAARILVQHLWETQRGAASMTMPSLDMDNDAGYPGVWFAIPDKVKQLLEGESAPIMAF